MLLEDFLQLLAGLGGQNVLYLQVQNQTLPLSKFVLAPGRLPAIVRRAGNDPG